MADEKQKLKQAQTLAGTAKNVGDPRNMAKILGVAGEGLWDFLGQAYDKMVPQTVEELALEGSPTGKAIGTAIGMIPPKYMKSLVHTLKNRVLNNPETPYKDLVEMTIDRNPSVAAHVGDFGELAQKPGGNWGEYTPSGVFDADSMELDNYGIEYTPQFLERAIAGETKLPTRIDVIAGLPTQKANHVLRHEMTHAAQDAFTPLAYRQKVDKLGMYGTRPIEVGARGAELGRMPLSQRLEIVLNDDKTEQFRRLFGGRADLPLDPIAAINERLTNQGMQATWDSQSRRYKIVSLDPRIVLDR